MEIPKALYGTHKDVKKWCTQHVNAIVKGTGFDDLDFGELTNIVGGSREDLIAEVQRSKVVEGLVLLDRGPRGVRDPEQHFRLYPFVDGLLTKWTERRLGEDTIQRLFRWTGRGAAWRIGCVLGEPGSLLCHRFPELRIDVLQAVLRHWPTLIEVGAKYATGLFNGDLWTLATNVTRGLGQLGATQEDFERHGAHLDELIRKALDGKLAQ